MANIMSKFRLSNKPRRNGFDLSRKHCFTASAGQLLPVFVEEVLPGDKFKINLDAFTRTQPLNTAAFARMREYYDLFFVPYHILWSHFPTMITQVPNATVASAIDSPKMYTESPWMSLSQLCDPIDKLEWFFNHDTTAFKDASRFNLLDDGYIPTFVTSRKLLDMLGYGATDWHYSSKKSYDNVAVSPFRLLAYQKIYSDFFRNNQWEDWKPYMSNCDFVPTNNTAKGSYNYNIGDIFGVGTNTTSSATWNKEHPATMRYCNLHKDLFLGVLPQSQYGNESVVPLYDLSGKDVNYTGYGIFQAFGELNNVVTSDGKITFDNAKIQSHSSGSRIDLSNSAQTDGLIELSILALRKAEALQKYKEITQSNDYDYRSQIEAHFGIKPDRGLSHQSTWLGGCVNNIGIDSVTNSNLSGESSTVIKGKATSAGRNQWTFDSNDYGVIMCIYHCEPLIDYPCHLEKKACLIEPTDFPIPEFDQIGLETIDARFVPRPQATSVFNYGLNAYGYVPRYAPFKTATDYVTGDFNTIEKQWTIPYKLRLMEFIGPQSPTYQIAFTYLTQKCSPDILDNIFTFGTPTAQGEWSSQNYLRYNVLSSAPIPDQFLCNTYWDTKVVRNLDRDGMPY